MTAPTLLTLTAQPARTHVIMVIAARLPLVHAPDLAMAYAVRLINNLNLWEQTPAWQLFPCTYFLLLDFCAPFLRFNVQSTAPLRSFWTSSVHFSASTSNSPCNFFPFGLCAFLRFNVQFAAQLLPFWTFSVYSTTSTSNSNLYAPQFLPSQIF